MRRYLVAILLFGALFHGTVASAVEPTRHGLAEELLLQIGVNRFVDQTMLELAQAQQNALMTMGAHDEAETLTEEFSEKLWRLVRSEMSWEKMKGLYIDLYAETFSEGELKELIRFYRSPVGTKYIEKSPMLIQRSIEIGQETARKLMPDLKAIIDDAMREREARKKEAAEKAAAEPQEDSP